MAPTTPEGNSRASVANTVGGTVHGSVLQVGRVDGDVTVNLPPRRRPDTPVVVGAIPRCPPAFQPRSELRERYDELTAAGQRAVALTGMRGIGKTQLAAAVARTRIEAGWPVVAWITASTAGETAAGLAELAVALGLVEEGDDVAAKAVRARRWAQTAGRCLLVFDNASDPDSLAGWLPATGEADVLITSTRRDFDNLAAVLDVEVFTDEQALSLLGERTALDDGENARALAAEVGHLPLALAQSAAVIRRQRLTYADFLHRLRTLPVRSLLGRRSGDPYPLGAAAAILLSFASVERDDPRSRALIDLLCLLSPAGVDRELIRGLGATAEIDELLGAFAEASLLTFGLDGATVITHRFIQRVARDRARTEGTLAVAASAAARLLREALAAGEHRVQGAEEVRGFGRHVHHLWAAVADEISGDWEATPDLVGLRAWEINMLADFGEAGTAIELGTGLLADGVRLLGAEHAETLRTRNNLGGAYSAAGDFDRASAMFHQNLRVQPRTLGPRHPDTVGTRNNLGMMHLSAGRRQRAVRMLEEAHRDRADVLGPDHPYTLMTMSNLGVAYGQTGRFSLAVRLLDRALDESRRVLDPDHPELVTMLASLADVQGRLGRVEEVIALRKEIAARTERLFADPAHPRTVLARSRLADAYLAAGRWTQAISLLERNLSQISEEYGPDSPLTRVARRNLEAARRSAGA